MMPPSVEQCRIDEAEGVVARYGDATAERRDAGDHGFAGECRGPSQSQQPIDIEGGADLFCSALDDPLGLADLASRDQAEMARRQRQCRVGGKRP